MNHQIKATVKTGSAVILVIAVTSACGGTNDTAEDPSRSSYPEVPALSNTNSDIPIATESPVVRSTPQPPDHRYDDRRGQTYYYIAAVSEDDRKKGRAVGNVIALQYLGMNSSGEHILAILRTNGTVSYRAKCKKTCRIIDTDYGEKIAYSSNSVIGGAFQDAFRGKLRIADWAKDEPNPSRSSHKQKASSLPVSNKPPLKALPSETGSNTENKDALSDPQQTKNTDEVSLLDTPSDDRAEKTPEQTQPTEIEKEGQIDLPSTAD